MKVLLVDDSMTTRNIQKNLLVSIGVTDIEEAENGRDALEKIAVSDYNLMLLDWNMPVMDGFTCLKTIRGDPSKSSLKIVMCTSESEKSKVMDALKAGANNYVVKPFTPQELKQRLGI